MRESTESAVIVSVPAAEAAVAAHRDKFDHAAGWGVPAHVTVLYPFVPPDAIDATVVRALEAAIASVPRFEASWASCGWFDRDVLWLATQQEEAFRALTTAVTHAFPDYPPYAGRFTDLVPHLTVGDNGTPEQLQDAERQVLAHLPIRMQVTAAGLWCGTNAADSWRRLAALPLG